MFNKEKRNLLYLLSSVLFGTGFALYYNLFSFSIFLLIAYIVLTYYSKELIKHYVNNRTHNSILIAFEILILIILLYLALSYSWLLLIVLAVTSLLLQIQRLFIYFDLHRMYNYLAIVLYIGVMNSLAFYIHTQFISSVVVYSLIPIVLLFLVLKRRTD